MLQGFGELLQTCLGIELETHVYPIYQGQKLLHHLIAFLSDYGFVLRKLTPLLNMGAPDRPVLSLDGDFVEFDAWFTKNIRLGTDSTR